MRATVLGGSAAGGNPGQGCSGYLVESGSTSVVLDLGPATLPQLRLHVDAGALDAIVVSHLHLDHILDLLALRYHLEYAPDRTGRRIPLWLPPGGRAFFDRLAATLADDGEGDPYFASFDLSEYNPASALEIGDLRLTFAPTVHYVPCWAIRVSDGAATIVYTADTGPSADLAAFCANASALVTEASADEPGDEPFATRGHLTPEEAGALAAASGARMLILSHLWEIHGFERAASRAATRYPGPILVARPGLSVDL